MNVPTVESDVGIKGEVVGVNVEETTGPVEFPTGPVDRQKNSLSGRYLLVQENNSLTNGCQAKWVHIVGGFT